MCLPDAQPVASLPPELVRARRVKRAGLLISTGFVTAGVAYVIQKDTAPSADLWQIFMRGLASLAVALGIAKLVLRDRLAIELYDGGLAIEIVPSLKGPLLQEGAVAVRPFIPRRCQQTPQLHRTSC